MLFVEEYAKWLIYGWIIAGEMEWVKRLGERGWVINRLKMASNSLKIASK